MSAATMPAAEAARIKLLARLLALDCERDALSDADEWAPDEGPLHDRWEEIRKEECATFRQLCHLGHPETPAGAMLAARLVLVFTGVRKPDGTLECDSFGTWLRIAALVGSAGRPEQMKIGPSLLKWLGEAEPAEVPA